MILKGFFKGRDLSEVKSAEQVRQIKGYNNFNRHAYIYTSIWMLDLTRVCGLRAHERSELCCSCTSWTVQH